MFTLSSLPYLLAFAVMAIAFLVLLKQCGGHASKLQRKKDELQESLSRLEEATTKHSDDDNPKGKF